MVIEISKFKKTNKEFIKEVKALVGNEYTFLENYVNSETHLLCRHNVCKHEWKVKPRYFTSPSNNTRCPKCAYNIRKTKKKKTNKEFIREVKALVGDEYTFLENYVDRKTKIKCIHNECGHTYKVDPDHFFRGCRCKKCCQRKSNEEFLKEVKDLIKDEYKFIDNYIDDNTLLNVLHIKCNNVYKVRPYNFLQGYRCPKCSKTRKFSNGEKSILKFIKKVYKGEIIENDKRILHGKEIDIYLPELKIGIEYCGLYWHSELYKNKNYHLNKLNLCHEKGIRLIQIFEDEWISKKNILKSKIKHILGLNVNKEKIFARKCTIKEISNSTKNEFLDKYHIQGKDMSKIKLGLFYDMILVATMTFNKPRICMSSQDRNMNNYELSRFATKGKYNIVGGFSKLLSHFKKNYEFEEVITYADLRYSSFDGNLYEVNGFTLSHQSKPNYWYFYKNSTLNRLHRFNFRKGNLKKLFPEIYDENLTEHEIMLKSKYLRIYDCGTLVYKLERS